MSPTSPAKAERGRRPLAAHVSAGTQPILESAIRLDDFKRENSPIFVPFGDYRTRLKKRFSRKTEIEYNNNHERDAYTQRQRERALQRNDTMGSS